MIIDDRVGQPDGNTSPELTTDLDPAFNTEREAQMFSKFTVDQKHAADEILSAVRERLPACIFVNGQGRSGKTYRLRLNHDSTINQLPDDFPTTTLPPVIHSIITKCLQTASETLINVCAVVETVSPTRNYNRKSNEKPCERTDVHLADDANKKTYFNAVGQSSHRTLPNSKPRRLHTARKTFLLPRSDRLGIDSNGRVQH